MRSMTGFGSGDFAALGGKVTVEIRAVNHRFLDVRTRMPRELLDLQPLVEHLAREKLGRGRFDVAVRLDGASSSASVLDRARAKAVLAELRALRDDIAPGQDVPFWMIAQVPDVFVSPLARDYETLKQATLTAFERAVVALDEMRRTEGEILGRDLAGRLDRIGALVDDVRAKSPGLVECHRKRLAERAERIRSSLEMAVDPGRLEQEIALFADRIDTTEELLRLTSHVAQFRALLGGDGVGRKLDFLLQEMARETNTVGAKTPDAPVAHLVVELKAEISRMREQVQNVE
jgi:uncharacterized protein (TIGR00255 family)